MKKLLITALLVLGTVTAQAQIRLGIKAGANFSDLEGDFDTSMRTGFHAGAVLELKFGKNFALQPELMYSMQGAKVTSAAIEDIDFNYVTVPVLVKYYLLTDVFSVEAGPQFAFLVDDNLSDTYKNESFDFGAVGGVGLNITKSFFAQARYVVGLSDASTNATIKNRVIQLSLGYMF